jgi:predicted nucleic acid-binding Zn ribbon protein
VTTREPRQPKHRALEREESERVAPFSPCQNPSCVNVKKRVEELRQENAELKAQNDWYARYIRETLMFPVTLEPTERHKCVKCGGEIPEWRRRDSVYCSDQHQEASKKLQQYYKNKSVRKA